MMHLPEFIFRYQPSHSYSKDLNSFWRRGHRRANPGYKLVWSLWRFAWIGDNPRADRMRVMIDAWGRVYIEVNEAIINLSIEILPVHNGTFFRVFTQN
jgi:hypothetical protein